MPPKPPPAPNPGAGQGQPPAGGTRPLSPGYASIGAPSAEPPPNPHGGAPPSEQSEEQSEPPLSHGVASLPDHRSVRSALAGAKSGQEELTGPAAIEVDNLVLRFNEMIPKCSELMDKYNEDLQEENINLLNSIKGEVTLTQEYVVEQDNLLTVFDALKKLNDAVDTYQDEAFERQKHTLIDYMETLKEALDLAESIKEKVKNAAEAVIYEEYLNSFIRAADNQVKALESLTKDRRGTYDRRDSVKSNLNDRVDQLLQLYRENVSYSPDKTRGQVETGGGLLAVDSPSRGGSMPGKSLPGRSTRPGPPSRPGPQRPRKPTRPGPHQRPGVPDRTSQTVPTEPPQPGAPISRPPQTGPPRPGPHTGPPRPGPPSSTGSPHPGPPPSTGSPRPGPPPSTGTPRPGPPPSTGTPPTMGPPAPQTGPQRPGPQRPGPPPRKGPPKRPSRNHPSVSQPGVPKPSQEV